MAEIIARFADGRLLVQEDKAADNVYTAGVGLPVRIGHVRIVEKVLSVNAHMSGAVGAAGMVFTPLREVTISGDIINVIMRRADIPLLLSGFGQLVSGESNTASYGALSSITSGLGYLTEIASGLLSGKMKIVANVIGF